MKKIYVVNDDFVALLQQTADYTNKGYYVRTFSSSKPLFAALRELMPDLIVLNINPHVEDGKEISKQIRNQFPDKSPLILFSGKELKQEKTDNKVVNFSLLKIFNLQHLTRSVASYLF